MLKYINHLLFFVFLSISGFISCGRDNDICLDEVCVVDVKFDRGGGEVVISSYKNIATDFESVLPKGIYMRGLALDENGDIMYDFFSHRTEAKDYEDLYIELSNDWLSVKTYGREDNKIEVIVSASDYKRIVSIPLFVFGLEMCRLHIVQQ